MNERTNEVIVLEALNCLMNSVDRLDELDKSDMVGEEKSKILNLQEDIRMVERRIMDFWIKMKN